MRVPFGSPEWRIGGVRFRAVAQPAVIGRRIGRCTIGPASSGLGEGLAGVGRHCKKDLFLTDLPR